MCASGCLARCCSSQSLSSSRSAGEPTEAVKEYVTWARAQLTALPFAGAFDVCTVFYDTLNHLPDDEALARTFTGLATVLRPGRVGPEPNPGNGHNGRVREERSSQAPVR